MSQTIVITAPPGLVVGDFAFGLYLNREAQDTSALGVVELPGNALASNYSVTGVEEAQPGEAWELTWNDGTQRGVRRWPASAAVPQGLVIPLRQAGVTLADLDPNILYLDGAATSNPLTLTDLGAPLHDYLLAGIPAPSSGSVYAWSYGFGAVFYVETWPTQIAGVNTAVPDRCDLVEDLLDLMPDTLLAQAIVRDAFGGWVPSGSAISIPCRLEGSVQLVRDRSTAREVVSSIQAILGGHFGLTTHRHRYTLPERYDPRSDLEAILVVPNNDEAGACFEEVFFP
jgi:hypothetical protein